MSVSTKSYHADDDINAFVSGDVKNDSYQLTISKLMSTKTNGIEALPYQFMKSVDRRIAGTGDNNGVGGVGRKYGDKIFSQMPLLFLTPCEPLFMDDATSMQKSAAFEGLLGGNTNGLSELVTAEGKISRYYSVQFAYPEYYMYLNTMLACLSAYLGIFDKPKIKIANSSSPQSIGKIDWSKELNNSFKTFFSCKENLVFYLDGLDNVSESFSNETTESSLASQINQFSDMSNEIKFLFGKNSSVVGQMVNTGSTVTSAITEGLSGLAQGIAGGIVGSLANKGVNSVLNGGKIIFPKIWADSQYSRSFDLSIKLRSPDHDSVSIFLNVLKPYCKLLALTMPREINGDPNAYRAPFLVKAFCKGKFNIDMGMITSLQVTKGKTCSWNDDGLPTEIDISLGIEDLYSSLAMSTQYIEKGTFAGFASPQTILEVAQNTAYMDFLANMAGLNIAQMEIGRRAEMVLYLSRAAIPGVANNQFNRLHRGVSMLASRAYDIF